VRTERELRVLEVFEPGRLPEYFVLQGLCGGTGGRQVRCRTPPIQAGNSLVAWAPGGVMPGAESEQGAGPISEGKLFLGHV
jgi:hypothetical protein